MVGNRFVRALLLLVPVVLLVTASPVPLDSDDQSPVSRFATYGVSRSTCDDVFPEPAVPKTLPPWATASVNELRAHATVQEIGTAGVFRKADEIVIKKCTTAALEDVVEHAVPYPRRGTAHHALDIYFGCGNNSKYIIRVKKEMHFGTSADNTSGTFRLIAPDFNVELNGERKTRIMKANRFSHLTLYGLVLRDGYMVDLDAEMGDIPSGGYSGSAVLASFWSTVVIYKCAFYNNWSLSKFVRYGSGGAIMAETGAKLYVWGSYFKSNQATNGGAIAASSAQIVYIASSTFLSNVAHGGYDMSKKKTVNGVTKPVLQIRGGAIRVDSVKGHATDDEHVFVCNTKFQQNRLKMKTAEMESFGYTEDEAGYLFAGASAFALWNKKGVLNLAKGDKNLLTLRGCLFENNYEKLPWNDDRAGRYVFEARGAGHINVVATYFKNNSVQKAVAGLDNSEFFKEYDYDLKMRDVEFSGNGQIPTVRFAPKVHNRCDVKSVGGMTDGVGDCISLLKSV